MSGGWSDDVTGILQGCTQTGTAGSHSAADGAAGCCGGGAAGQTFRWDPWSNNCWV